ncbi:hypothetical protein BSK62_17020 [Paenibacillus odorifer]|uniref:DUF4238 domain-containing protein n=1 Tax=Paenibacillus odorifer TaxID=189426 RepID=UPI00096E3AE6|nr:DUF4238 domain-containing protein [Paenibacillus odorifer]OMD64672.1 hypothetical protein BSK62_17020 [Paenibacillus odorifer]
MNEKANNPKRHHYIPVSYLSNFTDDGTQHSKLCVFDQTNGNQWRSRPKSIAFEKDFHTVETITGKDSKTFEEIFSMIEGKAKQIIKGIIETFQIPFPGSDDYNWLINFIALLSERTPARRKHFSDQTAELYKMATQVGSQHKEYFEHQKEIIENKTGEKLNLTHEQLKEFINSDDYEISFNNNFHMENFMTRFDVIIEPLGRRKWSVCYSPPELGDFVSSDNPVCLRNVIPVEGIFSSPGHAMLNTEVSVPLSPRVMLLGRFEDVHPSIGEAPNSSFVAKLNSWTAMYSERYVFSQNEDFLWWDKQGNVSRTEDFKRILGERS